MTETIYKAEVSGQAIRKGCRKWDYFFLGLGETESLAITDDLRDKARQVVRDTTRDTRDVKLRVEQAERETSADGLCAMTIGDIDSPTIEEILTINREKQ